MSDADRTEGQEGNAATIFAAPCGDLAMPDLPPALPTDLPDGLVRLARKLDGALQRGGDTATAGPSGPSRPGG